MQDLNKIAWLLKEYYLGTIEDKDLLSLQEWMAMHTDRKKFVSDLADNKNIVQDLNSQKEILQLLEASQSEERVLTKVDTIINKSVITIRPRLNWRYYVASLVLFLSIPLIYYIVSQYTRFKEVSLVAMQDVIPTTSNVVIVLPDGSQLEVRAEKGGANIDSVNHIESMLDKDQQKIVADLPADAQLTLEVPIKSTFSVLLSDGSLVKLNAGSKLKYPNQFNNDNRTVELEGEGFFSISKKYVVNENGVKERVPFTVLTDNQKVEVLGTKFNLNTRFPKNNAKTTLVEGLVRVNSLVDRHEIILKPGEQGHFNGKEFAVKRVDIDAVIAWVDDLFYFDGTDARDVLTELGKWYNIKVEFKGRGQAIVPYYGVIDRKKSLKSVLHILQKSGLDFQVLEDGNATKLIVETN